MPYLALYRRWRPQTFAQVVGQEHVVRTLKNAISLGRVAHAYLFSGPRGTGKTSIAKLLAKALNCEHGPTPDPCDQCEPCSRIREGHSMDVIEIDAASNRGIDEIRDLRERVRFAPAGERYKVYIIDEVHMLTTEAFNALLKTLEEPPGHVVFVLATTEAHRVPPTILSRCQRFDFRRLTLEELAGHIKKVLEAEGIVAEDDAIALISRFAEGSLRDALSLLEQVISFSDGRVTHSQVADVLGVVDADVLEDFSDILARNDVPGALRLIDQVVSDGKDVRQFFRDAIQYVRDLLVARECRKPEDVEHLVGVSRHYAEALVQEARRFTYERLVEVIEQLSNAERDLRWAGQSRIMAEVAMVRLVGTAGRPEAVECPKVAERPETARRPETAARSGTADRPEEAKASEAFGAPKCTGGESGESRPLERDEVAATPGPPQPGPPQVFSPDLLKRVVGAIRSKKSSGRWALLSKARIVSVDDRVVTLGFDQGFDTNSRLIMQAASRQAIEEAFSAELGRRVSIRCVEAELLSDQENGNEVGAAAEPAGPGPVARGGADPSVGLGAVSGVIPGVIPSIAPGAAPSQDSGADTLAGARVLSDSLSDDDPGVIQDEEQPLVDNDPEISRDPVVRQVAMFFGGRVLKAIRGHEDE